MIIDIVPVFGDNYAYLVICEETRQAAAVDPADPAAVMRRAEERGVTLRAVWSTHHHGDHTAGNAEIAKLPGVDVLGHASDEGRIPAMTRAVEDGEGFELGRLNIQVMHTPGHTMGSICYGVEDALFTGDTMFAGGCGRLFEGDPPTMFRSLETLAALTPETRVFCGHEYTEKNLDFAWSVEPKNEALAARIDQVSALRAGGQPSVPFTLADELATSPFLRGDSPEIRQSISERFPGDEARGPLQVFTRLRELRNAF